MATGGGGEDSGDRQSVRESPRSSVIYMDDLDLEVELLTVSESTVELVTNVHNVSRATSYTSGIGDCDLETNYGDDRSDSFPIENESTELQNSTNLLNAPDSNQPESSSQLGNERAINSDVHSRTSSIGNYALYDQETNYGDDRRDSFPNGIESTELQNSTNLLNAPDSNQPESTSQLENEMAINSGVHNMEVRPDQAVINRLDINDQEQIGVGAGETEPYLNYTSPEPYFPLFNGQGSADDCVDGPSSLLYAPMEHLLLIADTQNYRVKVYNDDCECYSFGGRGPNPGQFYKPWTMALLYVDLGKGGMETNVIVANGEQESFGLGRVQILNLKGWFRGEIGKGHLVAPTGIACKDQTIIICDCNHIKIFDYNQVRSGHSDQAPLRMITDPLINSLWGLVINGDQMLVTDDSGIVVIRNDTYCQKIELRDRETDLPIEKPKGLIVDPKGFIVVAYNKSIRIFKPNFEYYCKINAPQDDYITDLHDVVIIPEKGHLVVCGMHGLVRYQFHPIERKIENPTQEARNQ